jgi:hypothetical protein
MKADVAELEFSTRWPLFGPRLFGMEQMNSVAKDQ